MLIPIRVTVLLLAALIVAFLSFGLFYDVSDDAGGSDWIALALIPASCYLAAAATTAITICLVLVTFLASPKGYARSVANFAGNALLVCGLALFGFTCYEANPTAQAADAHLPIQKVEKMRLSISSAVVAPVIASMGRNDA